jgi:hypothetical protein
VRASVSGRVPPTGHDDMEAVGHEGWTDAARAQRRDRVEARVQAANWGFGIGKVWACAGGWETKVKGA